MAPRPVPTRTSTNDISVARTTASPSPAASGSGSQRAGGDGDELPEGKESLAGPVKGKKDKGKGTGKTSQRPSWSCTECTRRKIRCDRVVPGCNQCIKRNKVHLCRLDQDAEMGFAADGSLPAPAAPSAAPTGPPRLASATEYEAISRNIQVVRQRLYHLERVVRAFVPQPDSLDPHGNAMWAVDLNLLHQQHDHPSAADASSGPGSTPSFARDSLPLPIPPPPPPQQPTTATSGQPRDSEVEAATTLEFLALGRDSKESHFRRSELRRPSSEDDDDCGVGGAEPGSEALAADGSARASPSSRPTHSLAADAATPKGSSSTTIDVLPSIETSKRLVDYSLDKCLWQHGAVHSGQFRRECAEFYSWGERRAEKVNQAWLALYYGMLAVAVKHMVADDAPSFGYSADEQQALAKGWFDASVAALHRSNFMAKHQIYAVQAINLYAVSCQDIGESDLIATLLAAGIRIAQHLKMHLFGDDAEWDAKRRKNGIDPASDAGVKGLIEREIRKRVWYGLLTEDWISLHGRRAYAVSPTHFTTPLPLNCTDDDLSSGVLVNRTKDEPTPASKTILLYHVADILRRFFEHIHSSKQLDYAYCVEADRALRGVILNGPSFLKVESGPGDAAGSPDWTAWFRSYWIISISHKLLVVHRMFVAPAGQQQDERQMYSRRVTIEAARSVIQQLARSPRASTQSYWTLPYHTVSAATSIMLDIFQSPADPDVPNKRLEVQHALHELQQLAGGSHIAKRGVALLSTLLDEEARHRAPAAAADNDLGGASAAADLASNGHGALAQAGATGLSLGSPSMTSLTTPFFIPTLSSAPPAPSSSAPSTLPFLPTHAPAAAHAPAQAADTSAAGLATAPLSHEALHALFAGLGGESAFSHEAIIGGVGGGGGDVGPLGGLDLSLGGVGEDPAAVDFWRLLNAGGGGGGEELGGEGVVGMMGIEGGMGEWAVWPQ